MPDDLGHQIVIRSTPTAHKIGSGSDHSKKFPSNPSTNYYEPWKWENKVKTHRYSWVVFPFASFLGQCMIVTNAYFILMGVLQLFPTVSDSGGTPTFWFPVFFVICITMVKEFFEEKAKHKFDRQQNSRKTLRLEGKEWKEIGWGDVVPGDILKVVCDQEFPCDLLLLTSSDDLSIANVETVQLDGETNLKMKAAHPDIACKFDGADREMDLEDQMMSVCIGPPNDKIYSFQAVLFLHDSATKSLPEKVSDDMTKIMADSAEAGDQQFSVTKDHFLWRGASLRATEYVTGMCLYPGAKSRLFMNSRKRPLKKTALTRKALHHILVAGCIQVVLTVSMSALTAQAAPQLAEHWYLRAEGDDGLEGFISGDVQNGFYAFIISFCRLSLLLSQLVPITLLVQIEFSHWLHAFLMNRDKEMHATLETMDKDGKIESEVVKCTVNAVDVLDDLGCVTHIFSDKTGTLTQNLMQFRCVSFSGKTFGMKADREKCLSLNPSWKSPNDFVDFEPSTAKFTLAKAMTDQASNQHAQTAVTKFRDMLRVLAVCHTVVIKQNESGIEGHKKYPTAYLSAPRSKRSDSKSPLMNSEFMGQLNQDMPSDDLASEGTLLDTGAMAVSAPGVGAPLAAGFMPIAADRLQYLEKTEKWLYDDLASANQLKIGSATFDPETMNLKEYLANPKGVSRAQRGLPDPSSSPTPGFQTVGTPQFTDSAFHHAAPPDKDLAHFKAITYPTNRISRANYDAASPDELALVCGAKDFGVEFLSRTPTECVIGFTNTLVFDLFSHGEFAGQYNETSQNIGGDHLSLGAGLQDLHPWKREGGEALGVAVPALCYPVLDILEFDNDRKKMSVIIRDEEGMVRLLTKGADSSMLDSAAKADFRKMNQSLKIMSEEGLRTLVYGQRILSETEWENYQKQLMMARNDNSEDAEVHWQRVINEIESELEIVGSTGINDKLQEDCPETIADIKEAGVDLWVLTGDKIETAISIGHSCNLLTNDTFNCIIQGGDLEAVQSELNEALTYILAGKLASGDTALLESHLTTKKKGGVGVEDLMNFIYFSENKKGASAVGGTQFNTDNIQNLDVGRLHEFTTQYIASFQNRGAHKKDKKFDASKFKKKKKEVHTDSRDMDESTDTEDDDHLDDLAHDDMGDYADFLIADPGQYEEYKMAEHAKAQAMDKAKDNHGFVSYSSIALTIAGPSLDIAFNDKNTCGLFFALANLCTVVIACRVTPSQKALVVSTTKAYMSKEKGRSFLSLAIGDGANDVNMILTADVGVGIRGKEGLQAAQNADISIAKFKYLKNLMFVHGHEAVRKNSFMVYHTLWKNIVFGSVCFWYAFNSMYSAVDVFNAWLKQVFNLVFTAGPIMFYVWFDSYLPYHIMMANPKVYPIFSRPDGKMYFGSKWFMWWLLLGLSGSCLTVFVVIDMIGHGVGVRGLVSISFDDLGMIYFSICVFIGIVTVIPFVTAWTFSMGMIYVASVALWYLFWVLVTYTKSQDVYGSMWALNTSLTYHSSSLCICTIFFLAIVIWWLYKIFFRPSIHVIITERMHMGVDEDKMLGAKSGKSNRRTAGTIIVPEGAAADRGTTVDVSKNTAIRKKKTRKTAVSDADDNQRSFRGKMTGLMRSPSLAINSDSIGAIQKSQSLNLTDQAMDF